MSQSQLKSCVSGIVSLVTELSSSSSSSLSTDDQPDLDLLYDLDDLDETTGSFFDRNNHFSNETDARSHAVDLSSLRLLPSSKGLLPEILFNHTRSFVSLIFLYYVTQKLSL